MTPGDVVLVPIPEAGGRAKLRPAVVISLLPGIFQTLLICGISTARVTLQPNWDDSIGPGDSDFSASGLHQASTIRLSFLRACDATEIVRQIGRIDRTRLQRLQQRLSDHLHP